LYVQHVQFSAPRLAPPERQRAARRRRALLRAYLTALDEGADRTSQRFRDLEQRFVVIGAEYATEHGISAEAWLLFGVPRHVLAAAGIWPLAVSEHEARA
jgi:hypothetical protein